MGAAVTTIREMGTGDLDQVVALESDQQPRPWSRQVFEDELAADNRIYLVAEDAGSVLGFAGLMVVGDEAHVTNLLVTPDKRREGLGRELMIALIASGIDAGARHLTLEVRKGNVAARALYSRLGLAPVGIRPRYYGDDDALILWAHDIDQPGYLGNLK